MHHKEPHGGQWAVHGHVLLVRVYARVREEYIYVHRHSHLRRVYECECQYETERRTEWVTGHDLKDEMESARYELAHVSEHDFHHELHRQVFVLVVRDQVGQVHTQVLQAHVFYR